MYDYKKMLHSETQKENFSNWKSRLLVFELKYFVTIYALISSKVQTKKRITMKYCFIIIFIFNLLLLGSNTTTSKKLVLKKIDIPVKIDGIIDEVWDSADSAYSFVQFQPYHGKTPFQKTIAKILTTENSIYCLVKGYDDNSKIQSYTGKLDDFAGDVVSIMLDTFGDNRTAYKFAVSASGVRSDCRLLDDARNRDYNWDGIWFAESKIYDWGFAVEIEIPYKSIQYNKNLSQWGIDFDRWRSVDKEDIYWNYYEENEGMRVSKFGKLVFDDFKPKVDGLNLEIYPVGIAKLNYIGNNKYKVDPNAGIDIFYNPSQALTFQFTANPDFAQIEADPFNFNISRYESYFPEKRPFFTEGNEIFMPSGKQRNTGFYRPLELFYSRRIGKLLPDGNQVPLQIGTRAFGRLDDLEYGGFFATTSETRYYVGEEQLIEHKSIFASARIKKQIMENSSIGMLFVGKHSNNNNYGVLDLDGAFHSSDWQLAYQFARSFKNNDGDFAASLGFTQFSDSWLNMVRGRYIGSKFDIDQIGFVPWRGTAHLLWLTGPRWNFNFVNIRTIQLFLGAGVDWEKIDNYTDHYRILGYNMNFRDNWGFEVFFSSGKSKDESIEYSSTNIDFSSWLNISPKWTANFWSGYSKTYNFNREYLAFFANGGTNWSWKVFNILSLGTTINLFIEGNPNNEIQDITYNARPYFSLTPINDLNVKMYFDNVFIRSTNKFEQIVIGFLFSYNFSPKSWIYFAINEIRDRSEQYDEFENLLPEMMHTRNRAAVLKIKYLYYF